MIISELDNLKSVSNVVLMASFYSSGETRRKEEKEKEADS